MTLWLVMGGHGYKAEARYDCMISPCPTVAATGLGSYNYWLESDGPSLMSQTVIDKPSYYVPLMTEIAQLPWNGLTVASTFSGCGGSCLGYRLAGFKVRWVNEFVPMAQESYLANAAADCVLDSRDIRQVQVTDILQAIGLQAGELDLFDGSPPCQAFSMAGKRAKGWGKNKRYEHGATQKNETLFTEYIRLLRGLQPKVFVAENVSGLVKGVAKGYFKEILAALKDCGYHVEVRLLDAQWLGVPQMRQRIIFQGVRIDLGLTPAWPTPLPYRYSVREALPWIGNTMHDTGGFVRNKNITDGPCPSVTVGVNSLNSCHYLVEEPPRAYPDKRGAFGHDGDITDQPAPTILSNSIGTHWIEGANGFNYTDIHSEQFSHKVTVASPGNDLGVPSRLGRRKFTIAELKRICAFPDDFILKGSYAQQWERLGNSVPPVMMAHLAKAIVAQILQKTV